MSKAEERAIEAYPSTSHYWNAEPDKNAEAREFYIQGYNQAEKDKELTWRDMAEIVEIANLLATEWLSNTPWDGIRDWGFYQEVLKRFKDYKEKKDK